MMKRRPKCFDVVEQLFGDNGVNRYNTHHYKTKKTALASVEKYYSQVIDVAKKSGVEVIDSYLGDGLACINTNAGIVKIFVSANYGW